MKILMFVIQLMLAIKMFYDGLTQNNIKRGYFKNRREGWRSAWGGAGLMCHYNPRGSFRAILFSIALASACVFAASAQTNNLPFGTTNITVGGITLSPVPTADIPTSESSLVSTVQGFFTSFTGLQTFQTNDTLDVWSAAEQVGGNNTAAALGLSYNPSFAKISTIQIGVESVTRAAGIGGTILSQNLGLNAQYVYKDIKLVAFMDGSYEFDAKHAAGEFGVRIFKALTDNTYTGPTLSFRTSTPGHATTIGWCIGGKF